MADQRAIPTEYKGIQFRSKSEACFAKYVDYHKQNTAPGSPDLFWEYEPQMLTLEDGYTPDFRLIFNWHSNIWCRLIEYKPTLPTTSHCFHTLDRLSILANSVAMPCTPCIQCGSFWDNSDACIPRTIQMSGGDLNIKFGWAREGADEWLLRQQIAQTRFDLASEFSQWKGHLHG